MNKPILHITLACTLILLFFAVPLNRPSVDAQAKAIDCVLDNAILVFTNVQPNNCLDDAGWHNLPTEGPFSENNASQIVSCQNNVFLFPNYALGSQEQSDISLWSDDSITKLPAPPEITTNVAACSGADNIWMLSAKQNVLHFDGSEWNSYTNEQIFGKSTNPANLTALTLSPDKKTTWLASEKMIAHFDGSAWQVFKAGKGLQTAYDLSHADFSFDSAGNLWVTTGTGVLKYDGKVFKAFNSGSQLLTIATDSKSNVWAGTYADGAYFFDGKKWTHYKRDKKALASKWTNGVQVDAQDRAWIATKWGLHVFDGKQWTVFQVANSDIGDNHIQGIVILGKGPTLPALKSKSTGTVKGQMLDGDLPLKNSTVELCTESVPFGNFSGNTPCADQPDRLETKTDKDGNFVINKVAPANYFGFAVQGANKSSWYVYWGLTARELLKGSYLVVNEGETVDLGVIKIPTS